MHFIVIFYHSFYYVTYTKNELTCFTEQFEFYASAALPWAARGITFSTCPSVRVCVCVCVCVCVFVRARVRRTQGVTVIRYVDQVEQLRKIRIMLLQTYQFSTVNFVNRRVGK